MHFSISDENLNALLQTFQQLDNGLQFVTLMMLAALIAGLGTALLSLWKSMLMFTIVVFQGYPPPHCDALGNPIPKESNDENDEEETE